MARKFGRAFMTIAAFAAATLLSASARAGNIYGAWDPIIGGTYSNTGFRGEVKFFIPDDCLSTATPGWYGNGSCGSGNMYLIDAKVWLYNTTPPLSPPYPDLLGMPIVFSFSDPVAQLFGIDVAFNPQTSKYEVVGLDTDLIGPESTGYFPPTAPSNVFLFFASGSTDEGSPVYDEGSPQYQLSAGESGAYLVPATCPELSPCSPIYGEVSNPGAVTYTPEPGTLTLLLSALGAGIFMRRRAAAA